MAVADREKALTAALAQIEKQHGKGSVMRLGDQTRVPIEVIPTGSIALDVALGIGGLPRGRVVEIYGPESSGKTTVALHAIANAQAGGGICAFVDAEHALDPDYAARLGVDTDSLLVSQPDNLSLIHISTGLHLHAAAKAEGRLRQGRTPDGHS